VLVSLGLLGPLAWGLRACASAHPAVTEDVYARGVFPHVQRALAGGASLVPFPLAECLLALVALGTLLIAARAWALARRGAKTWRALGARAVLIVFAASGAAYFLFQASWGLLHARPRLTSLLHLDEEAPRAEEVASLLEDLLREADLERARLAEDENGVLRSSATFAGLAEQVTQALEEVEHREGFLLRGRVVLRAALASRLLSACELAGIYAPFTGEAYVNADLPECLLPFSAAHEGAHALGMAREDEANFTAWLACSRSSEPELRYSAALCALRYVASALAAHDPERVKELLAGAGDGIRRDLADVRRFWERVATPIARVSELTNDLYLKSQGQHEGTASYGEVVRLLVAWRR
jgi:hypothetical protein